MAGTVAVQGRRGDAHVLTAAAGLSQGGALWAFVVTDRWGTPLERGWGTEHDLAAEEAAFHAIASGLTAAHELRLSRVSAYTSRPRVVAASNGGAEVAPHLLGRQLQVRALLNCFRSARVKIMSSHGDPSVFRDAAAAPPERPLPLELDDAAREVGEDRGQAGPSRPAAGSADGGGRDHARPVWADPQPHPAAVASAHMMIAQVDRQRVTDDAVSAGTPAPSRPLSILPARTKLRNRLDRRQRVPFPASAAACARFRSPDGEALQQTADRSANAGAPSSIWGIPARRC